MEKAPQHHQALQQQRPLDLDAIEAFVRIAELGSFTRAADAMLASEAHTSAASIPRFTGPMSVPPAATPAATTVTVDARANDQRAMPRRSTTGQPTFL